MTITNDELPNNTKQNGIGPGPPDDCTTTHVTTSNNSTTTHSDLTGKSSNLSNSHDTATTTTSCSMCPSGSCLNFSSTDETDHDFDLSSVSPVCHCDFDCGEHFASSSLTATSPTTAPNDNNCTLSSSNSVMNLRTISSTNFLQHALPRHRHYISSPFKETMSPPSTYNISSIITSANSCATGPVTSTNSSYLCSTSAPTGATSLNTRSMLNKITSTHNNNTCSINNNSTSTTTTTLCSLANKTPPPHNNSGSSRGLAGFFSSNNIRSTSKTDVSECHHPQQQLQQQQPNLQQKLQKQQYQRHHNHHCHHHHHNNQNHHQEHFDNNQHKQLKSSDSLSDVSDTFEWWFQRHKRNSAKKSRYILQIQQPFVYILPLHSSPFSLIFP